MAVKKWLIPYFAIKNKVIFDAGIALAAFLSILLFLTGLGRFLRGLDVL